MTLVNMFLSDMMRNLIIAGATGVMMTESEWRDQVKGILKAELKRRNVSYQQLAARLAELGVQDTAVNIANKISRGGFTAVFMVQCLRAIGCREVRLTDS